MVDAVQSDGGQADFMRADLRDAASAKDQLSGPPACRRGPHGRLSAPRKAGSNQEPALFEGRHPALPVQRGRRPVAAWRSGAAKRPPPVTPQGSWSKLVLGHFPFAQPLDRW